VQDRSRQAAISHGFNHSGIIPRELAADQHQLLERIGDRAGRRTEHRRETERVVAANANHEMGRIVGHAFELMRDIPDHAPIDGCEGGAPPSGEKLAQLGHHIRPAAHISAVIEYRVSEQRDMLHRARTVCRAERQHEPRGGGNHNFSTGTVRRGGLIHHTTHQQRRR
jgi:hypothetical protein